jgi:hypothetical protein
MEIPGWGYQQLYIRGIDKNGALGIGFRYHLSGIHNPVKTPQKAYEEFLHRETDKLKRHFGNDFVEWDLSQPTWTLVVT